MHDVVIVGARCAGSPLAMLLARAGHDVVVVDRATFPSDTISTHFINSPGMLRLHRWGLAESLLATGCPPITEAFFDIGGDELEVEIPAQGPVTALVSPRRTVLDKILVDAATEAGAQIREGVSVDSLIFEDERVVGVRGHSSEGEFEARGRYVVGADGRHSVVAKQVDAPFVEFTDALSSGYYSYFAGTGITRTQLLFRDDVISIMFPTHDELTVVGLIWDRARFKELKRDVEGNFTKGLASLGPKGQAVMAAERAERFVGLSDLTNYLRKTSGPGWVLVGDACYHKDPIPADGITDAFRGAEMLAKALDATLKGSRSEEEALGDYEAGYRATADKHLNAAIRSASFDLTPKERFDAFFEARIADSEEVQSLVDAPG